MPAPRRSVAKRGSRLLRSNFATTATRQPSARWRRTSARPMDPRQKNAWTSRSPSWPVGTLRPRSSPSRWMSCSGRTARRRTRQARRSSAGRPNEHGCAGAMDEKLTEEAVRLAYKLILGRPVESEAMLRFALGYGTIGKLRDAFLNSREFEYIL